MKIWKKALKDKYGIEYLPRKGICKLVNAPNILWTTRCSASKPCKRGTPVEMYDSYVNRYFYNFALKHKLPFAVLSDKYGLHFSDERLRYYNVHPSVLSNNQKGVLGEKICKKAKSRGYNKIVFYNNSPLMTKPYFEILSRCKLPIYYTTQLYKGVDQ